MYDFNEIKSGEQFEDLAAAYFRAQKTDPSNGVVDVEVRPSGKGTDGGRDLLVTFTLHDSVLSFSRKWVVQCKFYVSSTTVSNTHISDVNIPTLIHEYRADGYLLICGGEASSKLVNTFERLSQQCRFGYRYEIWTGSEFVQRVLMCTNVAALYMPDSHQKFSSISSQPKPPTTP